MTAFTFQAVELDGTRNDRGAMLAFSDKRLVAVVSCLGDDQGACAGRWFVEALFTEAVAPIHRTFETLGDFEAFARERFGVGRH